ncbi:MAG: EamA family transporter [candidate division Zixibacteria bacterium]|nr:EamA family transporter [candidate division Zixibacteria bacterium]
MLENIPYIGEIFAFTTAVFWGLAVILFKKSGETIHPVALNIFKGSLSFILIIPVMLIMGNEFLRDVPFRILIIYIISGIIGIGLADTFFFLCLNTLGAGLTAIVDCLYSPFIISLSVVFLAEVMTVWQIVGVLMIISAVLLASNTKRPEHLSREDFIKGFLWGALAMLCIAVSVIIIKPYLINEPLLWVTQVRTLAGLGALFIILMFFKNRKKQLKSLVDIRNWKWMFPGSFLGNYLSLILWMAAFKYTQASTAAALNQTSNIFVFVFAALFLKEMITREKLIGIILAVGGASLIMFA